MISKPAMNEWRGAKFQQLANKEICLKPVGLEDCDSLFALTDSNRKYLRDWLPWLDACCSAGDTLNFIEHSKKQFDAGEALHTCVHYRGEIAGMIGFHRFDWNNRSTSIGYWLAQNLQGKGIITQSCRLLLAFAFVELGLNRVEIRCAAANRRSRSVPERLGFRNEGTVRDGEWLYDRFVDMVVYGMLAHEWKK